jgi:hypothetical protein
VIASLERPRPSQPEQLPELGLLRYQLGKLRELSGTAELMAECDYYEYIIVKFNDVLYIEGDD